jgi:pilus assembly protein Flp/PilA
MKAWKKMRKLLKDESGISAVEYALLLALIGAGIATAAYTLGGQVQTNIENATTALQQGGS